MPQFDGLEELAAGLLPAGEPAAELDLEGLEEALGHGVVPAVALAAHAEDQAGLLDEIAVVAARVLRAAVGVMDEARRRAAARESLLQGRDGELALEALAHRPADDAPGAGVEHDRLLCLSRRSSRARSPSPRRCQR
jgi:hypothetical protein